jgi:hypothetical protein
MSSFTDTTLKVVVAGALVLGGGIYYQMHASQRLDEARQALRTIDAAQSQAEASKQNAEKYAKLYAGMADSKIDRQEPFSVVSKFSPQEISQVGPLLGSLYQRDGYFFLKRFQISWQKIEGSTIPRVALDLQGRKVVLFSDKAAVGSPLASVTR